MGLAHFLGVDNLNLYKEQLCACGNLPWTIQAGKSPMKIFIRDAFDHCVQFARPEVLEAQLHVYRPCEKNLNHEFHRRDRE